MQIGSVNPFPPRGSPLMCNIVWRIRQSKAGLGEKGSTYSIPVFYLTLNLFFNFIFAEPMMSFM